MRHAGSAGPLLAVLLAMLLAMVFAAPASAIQPIAVTDDQDRIAITPHSEFIEGRGDSIQYETVPGPEGVTGRMVVRAATPGTSPNWVAFALRNPTDRPIERWLTAERYTLIGSGVIWPDLDSRRIEAITPSLGFLPQRVKNERADIFRITLEPGQTITFVAELATGRFTPVYVWKPLEYELKARERQLLNGILLGITGVLGIFLTAVFAANHKAIFPSAALFAWCVLAYLSVDFGFFHKLFNLRADDGAVHRAATEAAMAASLAIFLYTFLRLGSWHGFIRMLAGVWIVAQLALVGLAVIDPRLAATFARVSFAAIGALGALLIIFLAVRGQDRALSLVPTWMLFLVWIFGAGVTLTGRLSGDIVVSGLAAGLVLLVVLIGFTVTQFAFRSVETLYGAAPTEMHLSALAVEGCGGAIWEWHSRRDEIKVGNAAEAMLGLKLGDLSCKVDDFLKHVHAADREKFRLLLWSLQDRGSGVLHVEFRMRHSDNSHRWFDLDAATVPTMEPRSLRCVGLLRDITETKRAHERLLHDAVHDNLTGLPNRELFLDRLRVALQRCKADPTMRPTVIFLDIDKFKSVNSSFGLVVGDSLLLTVARRIGKHLNQHDTLARVGGDQFAILLTGEQDPKDLALLAERVRRSLRAPIKIVGQDIVLTGSAGIAVYDGGTGSEHELLKEAEIAMYRAKREGADRIEIFRPELRREVDDRIAVESDLRAAIEKSQLVVAYQPIYYLPTEELAGFEALVRWDHPRLGRLDPSEFVPVAEESDLIVKLGSYVLQKAVDEAVRWHKELPRVDRPLFVSVNVSSRQLFRTDLIQEMRHILNRSVVARGTLKLEVTESLVMENPEQATEILSWLKAAGADLALDDFGTGYSSLAYLNKFPFDTLKIDRSLVQQSSAEGTSGGAIVRSIVALAHELGRKVVAEGVETAEDAGFLRSLGCEYAQGYYYGEPMSTKEVLQLLRVARKTESRLRQRGIFRARQQKRGKEKTAAAARSAAKEGSAGPNSEASRKGAAAARQRAGDRAGSTPATPPRPPDRPLQSATESSPPGSRSPADGRSGPPRAPRPAQAPPPLPQERIMTQPTNAPARRAAALADPAAAPGYPAAPPRAPSDRPQHPAIAPTMRPPAMPHSPPSHALPPAFESQRAATIKPDPVGTGVGGAATPASVLLPLPPLPLRADGAAPSGPTAPPSLPGRPEAAVPSPHPPLSSMAPAAAPQPPVRPSGTLPPAIAKSLARLAGDKDTDPAATTGKRTAGGGSG